jgi:hypothetical protein
MTTSTKHSKKGAMPPLAAAVICERVLMEPDNVPSAIRIVDTVHLPAATMPERGTLTDLGLSMLVIFKKGDADGVMKLRLRQISPSGMKTALGESTPVVFTGPPEGGANIRVPVVVNWDKEGLYWFEFSLNNRVVARVPLKINVVKADVSVDASGT